MVLLEHLSGVDITRNHVASLRSEPSAVVIGGDARCVTVTTEPFVQPELTVENDPGSKRAATGLTQPERVLLGVPKGVATHLPGRFPGALRPDEGGAENGYTAGLAGVAQLVEHQLPKLRVVGSSPIARFSVL
jgi:hypothetical protein